MGRFCKYSLCDHWLRDGDGSCWGLGPKNEYTNTCSNNKADGSPVLGGHGCKISSYRMNGCGDDIEIVGYYGTKHTGDLVPFRNGGGDLRDNALRSVRIRKIPKHTETQRIAVDTDSECPGIDKRYVYHRPSGKKRRCLYDNSQTNEIREVYDQKTGKPLMGSLFTQLKGQFCNYPNNVFKNPGGGICLEYDEGKRLAKQYCSVGDRIAKDANCTQDNLGNHYETVAEAYCKTTKGRADSWCSCYNVANDVCKTHPTAAGCAKKKQVFDPLVKATPEKFRHVWSGKAKCFGSVCVGKKYVPSNANQGCDAPIQICAQSFDLSNISESTIEAKCEQKAVQNITPPSTPTPPSTQPSAGDSPSGSVPAPRGSVPTPSGDVPALTPSGEIDLEKLTDTQKIGLAIIGVLIFLIIISIIF